MSADSYLEELENFGHRDKLQVSPAAILHLYNADQTSGNSCVGSRTWKSSRPLTNNIHDRL
jgi:hypothetical protein